MAYDKHDEHTERDERVAPAEPVERGDPSLRYDPRDGRHKPHRELRESMQAAIKENFKLRKAVVDGLTSGRRHITVNDFDDVLATGAWTSIDIDSMRARADDLEQQRTENSRNVLRLALLDQGVPEDGVDTALGQLIAGTPSESAEHVPPAPVETPQSRSASLGELGGRPAAVGGRHYDEQQLRGLTGGDLIKAALWHEAKGGHRS